MLPIADDNPAGFWESETIVRTNQTLLQTLGHHWYDCLRLDLAKLDPASLRDALPAFEAVLREEYGDAPLFVIKDPRMSLFLDVWRPVLQGAVALLAIRHPAEVAGSLLRRNRCDTSIALGLWLHYILEAEHKSRDMPRAVICYDRFLRDWRSTMARAGRQAGIVWPNDPFTAVEDATRFVQAKYRHHFASPDRVTVGAPPLREWIAQTWAVLRASDEDGFDPARLRVLDQVRDAFAAWRPTSPGVGLVERTD